LYYASNTEAFANADNTYGIYGMQKVYQGGINAFLQGLDNQSYRYDDAQVAQPIPGFVYLSSAVSDNCSYYGIYPSLKQTSTRALLTSILDIYNGYNLTVALKIFDQVSDKIPGAVYNHIFRNGVNITGSFLALGLTRTPDIRLTALGLLSYYNPRLYPSDYMANGTSRLVVLQLGQAGGV
jgi:hypothetical protein